MIDDQLRAAYTAMILDNRPNLAVMFGSGDGDISRIGFETAVKGFLNAKRREAFGRNWNFRQGDLIAIGFMEHVQTNPHMHTAVTAMDPELRRLLLAGGRDWRKFRHRGDYNCQPIDDPRRYVSYIQKEFKRQNFWDEVFIYICDPHDRRDVRKRVL